MSIHVNARVIYLAHGLNNDNGKDFQWNVRDAERWLELFYRLPLEAINEWLEQIGQQPITGNIAPTYKDTKPGLEEKFIIDKGKPVFIAPWLAGVIPDRLHHGGRESIIRSCLVMVQRSDEVWGLANPTAGLLMEMGHAKRLGKPCREIYKVPGAYELLMKKVIAGRYNA